MKRYLLVVVSRYIALYFSILVLLGPASYILLNSTNKLLFQYPTARLIGIVFVISLIAIVMAQLVPTGERLAREHIYKGSFDYQELLEGLIQRLILVTPLAQLIPLTIKTLGTTTQAPLELQELGTVNLNAKLQIAIGNDRKAVLCFGSKHNGDPWTEWDRRTLQRFADQLSVLFDLAQARRYEQLRLEQIKARLQQSTKSLQRLNDRLNQRDHDNALQFDQLAHDLKNPVVVMSFALQERLTDSAEFKVVQAEVSWMTKFIDHILDLSRAEAGKIQVQAEPIDLELLVDDAVEYALDFAQTQNRRLIWRPTLIEGTPSLIRGDAGLLYKLLQLLLLRALRLAPKDLLVELHHDQPKPSYSIDLIFSALPQRQGRQLRVLLEDIKQSRPTRDDRQAGITGLELDIAHWILSAHGGQLSIPEADEYRTVLRAVLPEASNSTFS